MGWHVFFEQGFCSVVQLLPLHSSVLEPDFDLTFGEVELTADLPSFLSRDVRVVHEFILQDHGLIAGVRLPFLTLSGFTWNRAKKAD